MIFLLKWTGLYLGEHKGIWRFLILCRVSILFTATALYACRSLYRIFVRYANYSMQYVDLEYVVMWGWQFQSVMSMVFLFHWQHKPAMRYLIEHVIIPKPRNDKVCPMYEKLKMTLVRWLVLAGFMTACFAATLSVDNVQKINRNSSGVMQPTMGLHPFDFLYRGVAIYGIGVWNIVLCFFVVVMRSLSIELEQFNSNFEKLLLEQPIQSIEAGGTKLDKLSDQLLKAFTIHNRLARKVRKVDKIFRIYTFAMMAIGTPMTIFALITLIRRKSWIGVFYSIHDVVCCTVHLIGFTIVPAQIYTEFRAVQAYLYRNSGVWKDYDLKVYQIARMFTENVSQSDIGISLGGFIVITKSLILTCLSLVIPYVILCLQLNIGADHTPVRNYNTTS